MRTWLIIAALLLLLLAGGFFIVVKVIMPKAAVSFIPPKWQNIPLGQKRVTVFQYLGKPDSIIGKSDLWYYKLNESKQYQVLISYNTDTVASKYAITYVVKILGITNSTELQTDSL